MGLIDYRTYMEEVDRENTSSSSSQGTQNTGRPYVGYFSLKNDKDSAVVRIMIDSLDELKIVKVHNISVNGRKRNVSCLRDPHDPVEACPMCAVNEQLRTRVYIPLIEYKKEDDGGVHPYAKVWERPASYISRLSTLLDEYGPLSENLFRIVRNGAAGDTSTTYSENYCKPSVYPDALYKRVDNAFEGYSVLGRAVLELSDSEATEALRGGTIDRLTQNNTTAATTASATPKVERRVVEEPTPRYEETPPVRAVAPEPAHYTREAPALDEVREAPTRTAPTTNNSESTTRPRRYYA